MTPTKTSTGTELEQRALADVLARLQTSFPDVPAQDIESAVDSEYSDFDDSRVRNFIAVLVERRVREQLRGRRAG